jgi:hypothetical protein
VVPFLLTLFKVTQYSSAAVIAFFDPYHSYMDRAQKFRVPTYMCIGSILRGTVIAPFWVGPARGGGKYPKMLGAVVGVVGFKNPLLLHF